MAYIKTAESQQPAVLEEEILEEIRALREQVDSQPQTVLQEIANLFLR